MSSEWVNTNTQEICPECGASLQCLAGSSDHPNNWYCAKECGWQAWTSTKPPARLHHAKPLNEQKELTPTERLHRKLASAVWICSFGEQCGIKAKQKIASEATKSLGFKVTTFNVEYAANISGQDWARTNKTRTPNNTKRNLAWQKFNHEMRALARAHLDICAQLGTKTRNHEYIMKIALRDITESYESHNQ